MYWLTLTRQGFLLFTDHDNQIFISDHLAVISDLRQTSVRKVLRWAVVLSAYNYVCQHTSWDGNIWADLLSRWTVPVIRRLVTIPSLPFITAPDFDWPSHSSIRGIQDVSPPATSRQLHNGFLFTINHRIWIPDSASDLQLRICIIAHYGPPCHRGFDTAPLYVSENFYWSTIESDVKDVFLSVLLAYRPPAALSFLALTVRPCLEKPQALFCSSCKSLLVRTQMETTTHSCYATTIVVIASSSLFLTLQLKILQFGIKIGAQSLVFHLVWWALDQYIFKMRRFACWPKWYGSSTILLLLIAFGPLVALKG